MSVSVKCQYALRALFELARRKDQGLIRLQDVAEAQEIPHRFLENILNQLRQGGFVESRRGKDGGFILLKPASEISVFDVVTFIDGPLYPVDCSGQNPIRKCPFQGNCVFSTLWEEARNSLEAVYRGKTLQDLLDVDHQRVGDYVI